MKKSALILIFLALLLAGCGKKTAFDASDYDIAAAGTWRDGTYTERANGKNGEFDVTVIIADGRLKDIQIGDNSETPDKGGAAIEKLPDKIIEEQSVSVDAVSNATVTSDAIKTAVAKCLETASN